MIESMTTTAEQFGAYQGMFDHFNLQLFRGALPHVLLNLSRSGSSRTVAFFAPGRWSREDAPETLAHEISINPRHLRAGSALSTAQSLVHEMCHLWQQVAGTPPRRGYHDKEWSRKMLDIGLQPINAKTGKPAMSAHSMSDEVVAGGPFEVAFKALPVEALLPWACVEAAVKEEHPAEGGDAGESEGDGAEGEGEAVPVSKNKIKYTCPKCKANVWGKPMLAIGCVDAAKHEDGGPAFFEAQV